MCSGETKPLGNASFECHVLSFIAVTLNTVLEMFEQVPELETPSLGASEVIQGSTIHLTNGVRGGSVQSYVSLSCSLPGQILFLLLN